MHKTLSVSAIQKGTVIDHVRAGQGMAIVRLLSLLAEGLPMTIGLNLPSQSLGRKDLIKLENLHLSAKQVAKIAVFAPEASINLIEDYKVTRKFKVEVPSVLEEVLNCPNHQCISRVEKVSSCFHVEARSNKDVQLQCHYCERVFPKAVLTEKFDGV
ncbi:MAG: aspartate carbamoyltransferase regulatory subunit [Gammaproteobacteria bacterium]|nr:aspartate carbamoyltransferase regulatory subunit [Gammaproteobacteria bacterium]